LPGEQISCPVMSNVGLRCPAFSHRRNISVSIEAEESVITAMYECDAGHLFTFACPDFLSDNSEPEVVTYLEVELCWRFLPTCTPLAVQRPPVCCNILTCANNHPVNFIISSPQLQIHDQVMHCGCLSLTDLCKLAAHTFPACFLYWHPVSRLCCVLDIDYRKICYDAIRKKNKLPSIS
jgi:hypothetical protein